MRIAGMSISAVGRMKPYTFGQVLPAATAARVYAYRCVTASSGVCLCRGRVSGCSFRRRTATGRRRARSRLRSARFAILKTVSRIRPLQNRDFCSGVAAGRTLPQYFYFSSRSWNLRSPLRRAQCVSVTADDPRHLYAGDVHYPSKVPRERAV
ncbi:hypothetical protein EVAR_85246_1 [Eumeta japonica]|uniref:Uncharacterized protein n=1 Tax=Eumeta variegata TaxID=151549 RepID=A0A4C1W0K9_EUMVA|nr:hypothetical protein EVAR_85246_1 [Eumeta japonica]